MDLTPAQYNGFVTLAAAGVGLALVGVANLLLGRLAPLWRAAVALAVCGVVLGGLWAFVEQPRLVGRAAVLLAGVLLPCAALGSGLAARVGAAAAGLVRRPAVRWGAVAAAGLAAAVGSAAVYSAAEEAELDAVMDELAFLSEKPLSRPPQGVRAATDRGTAVPVLEAIAPRPVGEMTEQEESIFRGAACRPHMMRRGPADDRTNCHGWVFTGGRYWVDGPTVELILAENGYSAVSEPRPGDLVVYRGPQGIVHTAVVRYVTPGQPVLVEGKWGCAGVYLHPVDQSLYGNQYAFYQTARPGHLITIETAPPERSAE